MTVQSVLVEGAVDSAESAERAVREGAARLEVCARLDVGGLTPQRDLVRDSLRLGVPIAAMTSPRSGGHVYTPQDADRLLDDVRRMRDLGAQAIVAGCLRADGTVDEALWSRVCEAAGGCATVFHRAFDEVPDANRALDTLMQFGVARVLTSGSASTAVAGVETLARLVRRAAGRATILAGGGIRAVNVRDVVRRAGVHEVHARATESGVILDICDALTNASRTD